MCRSKQQSVYVHRICYFAFHIRLFCSFSFYRLVHVLFVDSFSSFTSARRFYSKDKVFIARNPKYMFTKPQYSQNNVWYFHCFNLTWPLNLFRQNLFLKGSVCSCEALRASMNQGKMKIYSKKKSLCSICQCSIWPTDWHAINRLASSVGRALDS